MAIKKLQREQIKEVREKWRVKLRHQDNARLCFNLLNQYILANAFETRCSTPKLVKGYGGKFYIDIECSESVAKKLLKASPGLVEFMVNDGR